MVSEKNTKAEIYKVYQELLSQAYTEDLDVPEDIEALTAKDTKSVLLDAVDELQDMIGDGYDEYEQVSFDTKITKEEPAKAEKPASGIKPGFTLGNSLDILNIDILDKIKAFEDTVNNRRDTLSDLGILEKELSSFIDVINSDRKKYSNTLELDRQEIEALRQRKQEELDATIADNQEKMDSIRQRLDETKSGIEEKKRLRDEQRAEEEEQFEYDLKIQTGREDDTWEDRLAKREQTIKTINEDVQSLREELEIKEKKVQALQAKLEELPELLDKAKNEGKEAKHREMEEENTHRTELSKRNAKAQFEGLEQMLDNLKKDYEERLAERDNLRVKLDKAYEESNKLYIQTVQSTGGIKILGRGEKD